MQGSGKLPTEYTFDVWRSQVDYRPNIHLVYAAVRWPADHIFNYCINWSGGLPTKYSMTV